MKTTKANQIANHVNNLVARYGSLTVSPETLWRVIRRAECKMNRLAAIDADGRLTVEEWEQAEQVARRCVIRCFANPEKITRELWVNGDPRGYALKLGKDMRGTGLATDWGGYGILAPEF